MTCEYVMLKLTWANKTAQRDPPPMKLSVIPAPHHCLSLFFFSSFLPSHLSHTFPSSRTWAPPSSSTGAGAPFLLISQTAYGFTEYGHIVCEVDLFLFAGRRGIGTTLLYRLLGFTPGMFIRL